MIDIKLLIDQLNSWKNGYLPPSAAITMEEAAKALKEQQQLISLSTAAIEDLEASLRSSMEEIQTLRQLAKAAADTRKADKQAATRRKAKA